MGEPPCTAQQVESELDLIDHELASELPGHIRAFARAHADGRPPPSAPLQLRLASTIATARNALAHDVLFDRGVALLRLAAPVAIEDEPEVAAARRVEPSWAGLAALTDARDAAARARFRCGAVELLHRLHGVATPAPERVPFPPELEGWKDKSPAIDAQGVQDAWNAIASRHGAAGRVRFDRCRKAPPRTFVVEPQVEVIVVVPEVIDTPAARFGVLHELGHALAALLLPPSVPRLVDEACASYVARLMEGATFLAPRWDSDLAPAARWRRMNIAVSLDAIERGLPESARDLAGAPPPALWQDPGAQASYAAAEAIADRLHSEIGVAPPRGVLANRLAAEVGRADRLVAG